MATYTIILLLLLAFAVMPVSLENHYTQEELAEMGIQLNLHSTSETQ